MNWLTNKIGKYYDKEIDGTGLALFRITFCMVMILEIFHLYYFYSMIFSSILMLVPLTLWLISIGFLMIGAFTRIMSAVNYVLCITIIISQSQGYHMNYAYFGVSFLFLFLPISNNLSIDRLLKKIKYSKGETIYAPSKNVTSLAYFLPLLLIPGLIYFESAVNWKMISPVWLRGLGMWLPGSIPYLVQIDLTFILNQKYLNIFCGYLTLVFEICFIFLFWFKRLRWLLAIIGIGLHIGILIFFPIPLFAIGMSCFYLLLFPVSIWKKIFGFGSKRRSTLFKVYYDSECPICLRTRIIISHFDIFKKIEFLSVKKYSEKEPAFEGISKEELLDNIYCIDKMGRIYNGVDTYIKMMYSMRYTYVVGLIMSLPGIYHLLKYLYRGIADARITSRCTEDTCSISVITYPENKDNHRIFKNYTIRDLKISFLKYGLIVIITLQLCISWNYGLLSKISDSIGLKDNFFIRKFGRVISAPSTMLFGLGTHAVYMDYAFYNYELKISYVDNGKEDITLPLIKDNGLIGPYAYGPNYVGFLFGCMNKGSIEDGNNLVSTFDTKTLNEGLVPWIKFWAEKHNIKPIDRNFIVEMREFTVPMYWEKNALKNILKRPWVKIGNFKLDSDDRINIQFNDVGKQKINEREFHDL